MALGKRRRRAQSRNKSANKRSSSKRVRDNLSGLHSRALRMEQLEDRCMLATFTVTTTNDLVPDGEGGLMVAAGSLRQRVEMANETEAADTIVFAENIFSAPTNTIQLLDNAEGDFGEILIENPLTILGPGPKKLIISGTGNDRIFNIDDGDEEAFSFVGISGVTLTNGSAFGMEEENFGGAIYNVENLSIIESEISGNAAGNGGGIFHNLGNLNIERTLIVGNTATNGAGVYSGLPEAPYSYTTIRNSTISGNNASVAGGGVLNRYGFTAIRQSTISGNSAYVAGGVGSQAYEVPEMGPPDEVIRTIIGSSIIFGNTGRFGVPNDIDDPGAMNADPMGTPPVPLPFFSGFQTENWNIIGVNATLRASFQGAFDVTGVDPLLEPLADRGGSTRVYLPGPGSIAIDPVFQTGGGATDFNEDGTTNFVDFLNWQRGFGKDANEFPMDPPPQKSDGDADGDFVVDKDDFEDWEDAIGAPFQAHTPAQFPGIFDQRGFHFDRTFNGIVDIGAVEVQDGIFEVNVLADVADNQFTAVNFGNTIPGNFSLREARDFAEKNRGHDTIRFDPIIATLNDPNPFTPEPTILLDLANGSLNFTESVNIIGPSTFRLEIDANDPTPGLKNFDGIRVFRFDDGSFGQPQDISISNLNMLGGDIVGQGGAIYSRENLTITNSVVKNSGASLDGGGVFIQFGDLAVDRSTFSNNTAADDGGAVYIDPSAADVMITNSTISGNEAGNRGAGIFNRGSNTEVSYSTITLNNATSTKGSGITNFTDGTITVRSSIVSGNLSSDVEAFMGGVGGIVSGGYNLIGIGNQAYLFDATGDQMGVTNPMLAPLALGGGPTPTHALLENSPAVDAGNLSPTAPPIFDQRGQPFFRIFTDGPGGLPERMDIGAYELQGNIFIVDNAGDIVDGDFSFGQFTLREALELSNLSPKPDVIEFSPILFGATISPDSSFAITDSVTIKGLGTTLLDITGGFSTTMVIDDGDEMNTIFVGVSDITFIGGSGGFFYSLEDLTLEDLVLTGNTTGAIVQYGGSLELNNSTITGNSVAGSGAGLYALDTNVEIYYSTISGNSTTITGGHGGGIYLKNSSLTGDYITVTNNLTPGAEAQGGGIFADNSTVELVNGSVVSGNRTTGSNSEGAGISAVNNSHVTISDGILGSNRTTGTGSEGGAIYLSNGSVTLHRTLITQNSTQRNSAPGGAIAFRGGSVSIYESTISNNSTMSSSASGGGIHNFGGNLLVRDSTISGNSTAHATSHGGGVFSDTNLVGTTTQIINSTISGNSTLGNGGGVYNADGLTIIKHSTITDNEAPYIGFAGGVGSHGDDSTTRTEVYSSIIAGNTANMSPNDVDRVGGTFDETFLSLGYNVIGAGLSVGAFNEVGDQTGVDPMLDVLANNGGPTRTHALLAGSPAIGAGDPLFDPDNTDPALDFDQRGTGFARVKGGAIDVGAYESEFVAGALAAMSGGTTLETQSSETTTETALASQTVETEPFSTSTTEETQAPLLATTETSRPVITGNRNSVLDLVESNEPSVEQVRNTALGLKGQVARRLASTRPFESQPALGLLKSLVKDVETAARDASLARFGETAERLVGLGRDSDLDDLVAAVHAEEDAAGPRDDAEVGDFFFRLLGEREF